MSTDYTAPKVNVPEPVHVNTALVALTDVVRPHEDNEGARDLGMIYKRCLQFVGAWEAHLADDDETSGSAHDPREGRQFMDCRDCATYGKHTRIPGCVFYEQEQIAADELTPEQTVRHLRAKAHSLERTTLVFYDTPGAATNEMIGSLAGDIALVASLLADHIEANQTVQITGPEASGTKYVTKTGRVLTDDDIEALAAEAEAGYDVSHLKKANIIEETLSEHAETLRRLGEQP